MCCPGSSPILALLFLVSALSTDVAAIILLWALFGHKNKIDADNFERNSYMLSSSDMLLIGFEVLVVFLFVTLVLVPQLVQLPQVHVAGLETGRTVVRKPWQLERMANRSKSTRRHRQQ